MRLFSRQYDAWLRLREVLGAIIDIFHLHGIERDSLHFAVAEVQLVQIHQPHTTIVLRPVVVAPVPVVADDRPLCLGCKDMTLSLTFAYKTDGYIEIVQDASDLRNAAVRIGKGQ